MGQSGGTLKIAFVLFVGILAALAIFYWQTTSQSDGAAPTFGFGGGELEVADVFVPSGKKAYAGSSTANGDDWDTDYDEDDPDIVEALDDGAVMSIKARTGYLQAGDKVTRINGIEVKNSREAYLVLQALNQPRAPTLEFDVLRRGFDGKMKEDKAWLGRDLLSSLELKGAGGKKVDTSFEMNCLHLMWASQDGDAASAEQIIKRGRKDCVNKKVPDAINGEAQTPLLAAVESENLGMARMLLKYGANTNLADEGGITPLMKASELGNQALVVLLLSEGADPRQRNNELRSAADIADEQGFRDIARVIENPSPRAFLPSDQRAKVPELLAQQNLISPKTRYHSDAELGKAIKEWQLKKGLAPTGMLTSTQFEKLRRDSKRFASKYNRGKTEKETISTLRRMDSRFFNRNWAVVDSRMGFTECEKETILFDLSSDGKEITMKTYRPGTSVSDIQLNAMKPTREATYAVERATIENDRDVIVVKNNATGLSNWKYQTWEIGSSTLSIQTMKSLKEKSPKKKGAVLATCR